MADRLAEIRARLEAATPGPWEWDYNTLGSDIAEVAEPSLTCGRYCIGGSVRIDIKADDAQFIAHAPEDIAWLLEQLADAWDEGAEAYATRYERDESLPLTNPYRKATDA
jgi:hypothetical protein